MAFRLIDDASGGRNCEDAGDDTYWVGGCYGNTTDVHMYSPPDWRDSDTRNTTGADPNKALVLGEFGGILLTPRGHAWDEDLCHGYATTTTTQGLADLYATYSASLRVLANETNLAASVYTEITDVETECNGLLTYDRIYKASPESIYKENTKTIRDASGIIGSRLVKSVNS